MLLHEIPPFEWFNDFITDASVGIKAMPEYSTIRYFFLKIGKVSNPIDVHRWLKTLGDTDFKTLFYYCTDDNFPALLLLSVALRAKIGDLDDLSLERKPRKEAYVARLKELISAVALERTGGAPSQRLSFSIQ